MLKRMLHSAQTVLTKPVTMTGTEIQATETVNAKFDNFQMSGKTTQDGEPAPDHPIEIVNAGKYNEEIGRYEIGLDVSGRNLLCNEPSKWRIGYHTSYGGITGGNIDFNKSSHYALIIINVLPNTLYSFLNRNLSQYDAYRIIEVRNDNSGNINHPLYAYSKRPEKYMFTTKEGTVKIIFELSTVKDENGQYQDITEKFIKNTPIILKQGEPTIYEPYHAKEVTITSPVPLTKWDKLVKRDGIWGWSIWSKHYNNITDASVDGSRYSNGIRIYLYDITSYFKAECTCTIAASNLWFSIGKCGFWFNRIFTLGYDDEMLGVNAEDDIQTILQKFKDNILSKGISVVCQTQEEQSFIPLPDEEQILMNSLQSYYPTTIIRNTEDLEMEVTMKSLNILGGGYKLLRLLLTQRRWCYA